MRKLSARELDQVKRAIAAKDLTSAEILVEIYDHYVSHLESFEKTTKKELLKTQCSVCKSYFSWPKIIATTLVLVCIALILENLEGKTKLYALAISMGLTLLLVALIGMKSFLKVRRLKKSIGITSKVQSSFLNNLWLQFQMVLSFFYLFVLLPKLLFESALWFESTYFIMVSFFMCLFYIGYLFSLIEAWKIKSKTFMI